MSSDSIEQFEHFNEIDSPEFERHDRYNFEVSLDYLINSKENKKNIFMLEMFGFIPNSLQINEHTYSQSNFYSDTRILTRYKTPKISLKTLTNPEKSRSPLNRIESYLDSPEETQSKLKYEIRMLGAISRVNIRDRLNLYAVLLNSQEVFDEKQFLKFLSRVKTLKSRLQELYEKIIQTHSLSKEIRNAFSFMVQFVFIQVELRFSKFFGKVESKISEPIKKLIIQLIEETREEKKRFQPSINLDFTESGEKFEHSEGLLKKYTQRVLYLEQVRKKKENQVKQMAYSIAAGIAMVVSILLTILIVSRFQQNSLPFVVGIVVIYMFKDRIKFFIQWLSKKTIRIFIADRTHKIFDPFEKTYIGIVRETMRFLNVDEIPREIVVIRDLERSDIEHQENLERVIKYKKIMQLKANTISKIHTRVRNVHDILRFNIKNFIQYADDPFKEYPVIDKELGDNIKLVRQYKVYHLNLIFRITRLKSKKDKESFYKKVRIVLDQNGIKRLEYPKV